MGRIFYAIILLAFAILAVAAILFLFQPAVRGSYVEVGGRNFTVELARTPQELQTGLMFRESLCADCGMLFVFGEDGNHSFWMRNTVIPLDMVFIDANLTVVGLFHAIPCARDPCQTYTPSRESRYVLETNANEFSDSVAGSKMKIFLNG
jgi:hypothetical protein